MSEITYSDGAGQERGPRFYISVKLPGNADAMGLPSMLIF